jgi:NAD(P)-dependent dehydrogenase (short-subunit alcohol dehydrogenase family)
MKLCHKLVVITGSGSGIGEALARRYAGEGAQVVVADRNGAAVDRVSAEVGCKGIQADMTREGDVRAVAELAKRAYGPVDIWFSNAGQQLVTKATDHERWIIDMSSGQDCRSETSHLRQPYD